MNDNYCENEVLQNRYTTTLQRIDSNFVKAIESAEQLLNETKKFTLSMRRLSDSTRVWSRFFDKIGGGNSAAATNQESRNEPESPYASPKQSFISDNSQLTCEIATPKLPVFSSKVAQTLSKLKPTKPIKDSDDSLGMSSLLGQLSPETVKMVAAYKTPIVQKYARKSASTDSLLKEHQGVEINHEYRVPKEICNIDSPRARDDSITDSQADSNILDISEITPATPSTLEYEFNESTTSCAAELIQGGTPAKRVTDFLLGSGTRQFQFSTDAKANRNVAKSSKVEKLNLSNASSDAATPQFSSPLSNHNSFFDKENNVKKTSKPSGFNSRQTPTQLRSALKKGPQFSVETPISHAIATKRKCVSERESYLDNQMTDKTTVEGKEDRKTIPSLMHTRTIDENGRMAKASRLEFSLDLFPEIFRNGEGAEQVTRVFSLFSTDRAYTLPQISDKLPGFSIKRLELMLELLVSVGLLRPFQHKQVLLWRATSTCE